MDPHSWHDRVQAKERASMAAHLSAWSDAGIDIQHDLVCLHCFAQQGWTPVYLPTYHLMGRTSNPVLMLCPCGACMTFEEGLTCKELNRELLGCFLEET